MRDSSIRHRRHHAFIFVVRDAKKSSPSAFRDKCNANFVLSSMLCQDRAGRTVAGRESPPSRSNNNQCPSPDTFSPRSYDYLTGPKRIGTCFQSISPPSTNNPTGHTHTHVQQQTNIVVHALRVAGYIIRLFAFSYPLIHVNMLLFYHCEWLPRSLWRGDNFQRQSLFLISTSDVYMYAEAHFWRAMAPLCHDMQSHNMLTMNDQRPPPDTSSIGSFPVSIRMSPFGLSVVMDA
jgi:hypothetical protein